MITLRTKFRMSLPRIVTDGTFNIVSVSSGSSDYSTQRYTFAGDAVTAAASLATNSLVATPNVANGNTVSALFIGAGGTTNGCTYTFANDATLRLVLTGFLGTLGASSGNDTKMMYYRGNINSGTPGAGSNTTMSYTYANSAFVAGGNLTAVQYRGGAAGNKTTSYVVLGGPSASVNTNKYDYATDSASGGSAFSATMWDCAGASDGTRGVFRTSNAALTARQYMFAADTTATATSLLYPSAVGANGASGSAVNCYFVPQVNAANPVSKYSWADDVVTAGSAFSKAGARASVSNGTAGVTI